MKKQNLIATFGLAALLASSALSTGALAAQVPEGTTLAAYEAPARDAAAAVTAQPFIEQGLQGPAIGEAVRKARIAAIAAVPRI